YLFYAFCYPRALHPFPTRRSSDLPRRLVEIRVHVDERERLAQLARERRHGIREPALVDAGDPLVELRNLPSDVEMPLLPPIEPIRGKPLEAVEQMQQPTGAPEHEVAQEARRAPLVDPELGVIARQLDIGNRRVNRDQRIARPLLLR